MKQNVAVLTTTRSEYYQLGTTLEALKRSSAFSPQLFVSGSHLSAQFGKTERDVVSEGFDVLERLPILVEDDSGLGSAITAGLAVQMIGGALVRNATDLLILAGDRYETLAAALAAVCAGVPVAHAHGGEITEGALDDACRHAITKLSALHFVSTDVYRARVIQMGESPERVFAVGALFLDQVMRVELLTEQKLADRLNLRIAHPVALVAYHPVTREQNDDGRICRDILEAVNRHCKTVVVTAPNHDPGYETVLDTMRAFSQAHDNVALFANLGSQVFLSLMSCADIMIGNSSSGIHEAVSFQLPVVNVGSRQAGRLRPGNVVDCEPGNTSIGKAVSRALSDEFRRSLAGLANPYGGGKAGELLVAHLERFLPFREVLLRKLFYDGPDVKSALVGWKWARNVSIKER